MATPTRIWCLHLCTGENIECPLCIARLLPANSSCVIIWLRNCGRYERWAIRVAGTSAVKARGVENIELSDIVGSHTVYLYNLSEILKRIGININHTYKFF